MGEQWRYRVTTYGRGEAAGQVLRSVVVRAGSYAAALKASKMTGIVGVKAVR